MQRLCFTSWIFVFLLSCADNMGNESPPVDHPYFPSALVQGRTNENMLYVFSSNFDRRYARGSVLSVDLLKVDAAIANSKDVIGTDVVTSSGFIPNFVDGPTITMNDGQILYLNRDEISLRTIALNAAGEIACPNRSAALGQDCFSHPPAALLSQSNPYFLNLFEDLEQNVTGGVIGYLLDSLDLKPNDLGGFALPQYFEFERFTWNTQNATAQIESKIGLGDILKKAANPGFVSGSSRLTVNMGEFTAFESDFYILMSISGNIVLGRISGTDIRNGLNSTILMPAFDLTSKVGIASTGALAIRKKDGKIEIFTTNAAPGSVIKLQMPETNNVDVNGRLMLSKALETYTCDMQTEIKLSPDGNMLIVACRNGKIFVYDADTLLPLFRDPDQGSVFGRSPTRILFDSRFLVSPFRFYTTNFLDGSISVYELSTSDPQILTRKGHIFQPAPLNRLGGIQ